MSIAWTELKDAFENTSLFDGKNWRLSPAAWRLTSDELTQLESIGSACLDYHRALETLYSRSAADKNLLRNKSLRAPWVAEYLDRGKPSPLVEHARDKRNRGAFPAVLRPDLLLTDSGWIMSELDSVPGGIGLTAFLNRLYQSSDGMLGADDAMIRNFHKAVASYRPEIPNPSIALVVSEESATYRPEMQWLAAQLQQQGHRVHCLAPDALFPLGSTLCFDLDGNPEKIDIVYRFFELFDLKNLPFTRYLYEAWQADEVAITPPMRPYQEEKLGLALFHHQRLQDFWKENLSKASLQTLRTLIPKSWIVDPAPLPPGAILDAPPVGGAPIVDWHQLGEASQKERNLILKISGFHETAWGARSVVLGSDSSREQWVAGIEQAIQDASQSLHILQEYHKPRRLTHPLYDDTGTAAPSQGRLRLCPYYFVCDGAAALSGALATFCPPDKKIIHGMQDAALLPCQITQD